MAAYKVLRKFSSNRPHEVGEVVEFNGPHILKLIDQRYIVKVEADSVSAPVPEPVAEPVAKRGRGRPKKNRASAVTVPTTTR